MTAPTPTRYVSGIRPTGHIHLGNYLGAIKQWKALQENQGKDDACIFFIADLHGIHTQKEIDQTFEALLKCGIRKYSHELQSNFGRDHLVLHAKLLHFATIGHLSRMTQYKDKSEKEAETAALLTYPVLMAADILFHEATLVPVGNDQVQHIEFTRDLFDRSREQLGLTVKPQAMISEYPRIMSLTDATRKMSKSDPDDMSRINVTDSPDQIRAKIMAAKSSMAISDDTPEAKNLRTIYRAVGGKAEHDRWPAFKRELVELLVAELGA